MKRALLVLVACSIAFAGLAPDAMAAATKPRPLVKLDGSQFGPVLFSGGDHDPRGDVLCNDVFEFGGTWFALDARGKAPS